MATSKRGRLLLWASVLSLAGCAGTRSGAGDPDPLTGGPPLPRGKTADAQAGRAPAVPAVAQGGPLPALPAPHTTTSPADLASTVTPPLDPPPKLAIRDGDPAGRAPVRPAQQVPLLPPEPLTPGDHGGGAVQVSVPLGAPVQKPIVPVAGVRLDTYPQIQEALAARGVTWQRLEMTGAPGEWKFTCSIPNKKQRDVQHTVEARAVGESGLAAMRAAVQHIDAEAPP
jgi:hypothetical protein